MKHTALGIGLLAGGMLAVLPAQANQCHSGHTAVQQKKQPASAQEKKAEIKLQTTCPVMGGKINKELYVDHDGKRVYLCCKGCEAPVKKDPAKYIKALEDKGVTVAHLQTKCPVMGGKINKELYVDHDGKRIYVCCSGCIGKIKADPAKYVKTLQEAGVVLAPVPKKIDPKEEAQGGHEGRRH